MVVSPGSESESYSGTRFSWFYELVSRRSEMDHKVQTMA